MRAGMQRGNTSMLVRRHDIHVISELLILYYIIFITQYCFGTRQALTVATTAYWGFRAKVNGWRAAPFASCWPQEGERADFVEMRCRAFRASPRLDRYVLIDFSYELYHAIGFYHIYYSRVDTAGRAASAI